MRATSSSVAARSCSARVGHGHVVELGRAQQPVDVLGVAEHRRPELGVVAADALEDAGAVVQAVRQDVDLRVLPGDEVSVHPDEVGGIHVRRRSYSRLSSTARVACAVPSCPPRSAVRRPPSSARCTADSTAAASLSKAEAVAQHQRRREEHRQRIGDPLAGDVGRRAVDRLEQPERRPSSPASPSEALGSIPIEPVSIAASSERMSPNRFSVRITSKCRGAETSCIAALSTSTCSSSTFGNSCACTRITVSRQSRLVSSTLALSTLETRDRARAEGDARDPLDLLDGVGAQVAGHRLGALLLAEVDAAGQLAHDQQVGALDPLAAQRRGVVQRGDRPDGPQVRVQAEPLAQARAGPARGAARRGRSCPTSARRRPPAAPRRRRGRRRAPRRSARCRGRRSRRRRTRARRTRSRRGARSSSSVGAMISGPDPVAGERDDAVCHGRRRYQARRYHDRPR